MKRNARTVAVALQRASLRWPDQRAGQLIFNALDGKGLARYPDGSPRDIFYVDDDQLVDALNEYAGY